MSEFPLFLDLRQRRCLVVGGGRIGQRRAQRLVEAGAVVDLVSISATPELVAMVTTSGGHYQSRRWHSELLKANDLTASNWMLIVAATDDAAINNDIVLAARQQRILANAVTRDSESDFHFPSVIDRAPLTIAVSSGSGSPLLARLLSERINALVPRGFGELAELVRRYRARVRQRSISGPSARIFWEKVLTGQVAEQIFSGNLERAEKLLEEALHAAVNEDDKGEVYLIGAGPGDPELLTFRAYRLLQQADVVLFDRLVSERILALIPDSTERIYVGKRRSDHSVPQPAINQQLLDLAQSGKRVARLKGGDPFIFGRGGEEIALLAENQIAFQVVPGITAAAGCASYSGIPLTHRDHAQSVRFITGQLQDGSVDLPWQQLVEPEQTLVIYMGLQGLPVIASRLVDHGMDPETPAALIEQGTTPDQKVHVATLARLPDLVAKSGVRAPTLLIIGGVVSLHTRLNWFNPTNAT